ncbi:MAG: amidoligase family protein [Pseudomonadota bacterium]
MVEHCQAQSAVGVEIEFAGLEVAQAAALAAQALGGRVEHQGTHLASVEGSAIGRIRFELDTRYAKEPEDPGALDQALDDLALRESVADALSVVVPVELITEPLDAAALTHLDTALDALAQAGATGTKDGALSAFGMHLNVALDPPEPARAIRIAAAYAFVEPWLRTEMAIDLTRRATPFVDPYPQAFVRALARACREGQPGLARFIALYGAWNPSRNRGLDLWPLLGHLDPDATQAALGAPAKGARPAFHYRLPDSLLGQPGWSPQTDLTRWRAVERIADDPTRFQSVRKAAAALHTWRCTRRTYATVIGEAMA